MNWTDLDIKIPYGITGQTKVLCPKCSATRKNKADKCLSVNVAEKTYNCHNCGWNGRLKSDRPEKIYAKPTWTNNTALSDNVVQWFKKRGISQKTLQDTFISEGQEFMPQAGKEVFVIKFPYILNKEVVNVKMRTSGKNFRLIKDAILVFYNMDACITSTEVLIVEGEIDALSFIEAGYGTVVSVPNGASKGNQKLEYLDNCWQYFENKEKIYIGTDNDEAGIALRNELVRRLGDERCFLIDYKDCKDANETLTKHGAIELSELIKTAKPVPIEGIFMADQMMPSITQLYESGFEAGLKVGLGEFDNLASFVPGQMTIITGTPSSGKSEFLDYICQLLAVKHDWKFGIFSPENFPIELHVSKILEKIIGKRFGKKKEDNTEDDQGRMTMEEIKKAMEFINDHFYFIRPKDENYSLDNILTMLKKLILKYGINGAVIDPWNSVEHQIPQGISETSYINNQLAKMYSFKQRTNIHLFLVAHPVKMMKDKKTGKYEVPTLYNISGCHDSETEVLTSEGWVKHKDLDLNRKNKVACFDLEKEIISYQVPSCYHKYPHSGELIHFNGKAMDIMVTPNHRMVVKPHWGLKANPKKNNQLKFNSRKWQFIEAKNIKRSAMLIPKSFDFEAKNNIPDIYPLDNGYDSKLLFSLIGWYVSEGWETMGSIAMCQRVEKCQNMVSVIGGLKLKGSSKETHYKLSEKPMYSFRLFARSHPELAKFIIKNCGIGSSHKKLPSITWEACNEFKKSLFDSLMEGDGSVSRNGYKYHTASKQLADDVSRLSYELGYKATQSFSKSKNIKWKDRYVVFINRRKQEWLMPVNHKKINYEGYVYCLTVPTGAYVTRRNGKIAITGNSAHFYNRTDNGITIYRDFVEKRTYVYVQKWKFKHQGKMGHTKFIYDWDCGRYNPEGLQFDKRNHLLAPNPAELEPMEVMPVPDNEIPF